VGEQNGNGGDWKADLIQLLDPNEAGLSQLHRQLPGGQHLASLHAHVQVILQNRPGLARGICDLGMTADQ
jgi:hypothetical protein